MVSPLFTAFALIATGQVHVPPSPPRPAVPEVRILLPEESAKADRSRPRR